MNTLNTPLQYGSVCSGIEATTVAWEPLGLRPAWFAEIDPFPNAVLAHHYPNVANLGDMTLIANQVREGAAHAPDILVGGTPCQAFSIAGLRQGLADPRGALTLKYTELANAIDYARTTQNKAPAVVLWENVPGVLNDHSNAFGCFLGALSGEDRELLPAGRSWTNAGCVYGPQRAVAWRVLDAQYFGLAQRRKRVFVVASSRTDFDPVAVLVECDGVRRDTPPSAETRQEPASASTRCAAGEGRAGQSPACRAEDEPADPIVCFGGGNTRGPIERAACLTARGHKCDFEVETFAVQGFTGRISHTLNTANNGRGSSEDGSGRGVPIVGTLNRSLTANEEVHAISGSVSHPLGCASSVTEDGNGRGVPIVSLRYRMNDGVALPFGDTDATLAFAQNSRGEVRLEGGRGQRVGALSTGGGIPGQGVPVVAQVAPTNLESTLEFEAHLQCRPTRHSDEAQAEWWQQWQVRRLMPLECERLQGLPDDYTRVSYRGAPAADGPRYKAIGNSMAVPCVAWIGRRLIRMMRQSAT